MMPGGDIGGARTPAREGSYFGLLAFLAATASLVTCYVSITAEVFLGAADVSFNPHLQAVIMWGFGVLTIVALALDRRGHGRSYPVALAGIGVAILVSTLYIHYDQRFEVLSYVLLFVGALLNQRAMIASLFDNVREQSREIEAYNHRLAGEVERQVGEIGRLNRLKGFLPTAIAEMVVDDGGEERLASHRRFISCLTCDIRNFTEFADRVEPEETIKLLRHYHEAVGTLIAEHNGTIAHRAGDGIMVIFNDPIPCERPVMDAISLGLAIHRAWGGLKTPWERLGHCIGLGVGIASGYATLGLLGDSSRVDYTAIGNVVNLAARLCDEAVDGELLIDARTFIDAEAEIEATQRPQLDVKGYANPVACYRVDRLKGSVPPAPTE